MKSVARICRLVEGMPLGVELAAAWVEVLSPQEIAAEIQSSLDFLATEQLDTPERHQSIRAVFDHTWRLMSDEESEVFKKLSVFRGGFTREATKKVVGTSLRELMRLVNKSLLQRDQNGRYQIHELLRQYAAQKLGQKEEKQVRDDHCDFYIEFLSQRETDNLGGQQADTLADVDNIRLAWQWAYNHKKYCAIRKSYLSLFWLYQIPGWFNEALSSFARAEEKLRPDLMTGEPGIVYGAVLFSLGWFTYLTGDHERGLERIIQSQTILRKLAAKKELAIANAIVCLRGGQRISLGERVKLLEESLAIFEEMELPHLKSDILLWLGWAARDRGELEQAEHYFVESLRINREINSHRGIGSSMASLGDLSFHKGDYSTAREHYQQQLTHLQIAGYKSAICTAYESLAYTFMAMENFPGARDVLLEALAMHDYLETPGSKAFVLHELGLVAIEMGEYEKADDYFTEALNIYRTTKDRWGIGIITCDIGILALAQGENLKAWKWYYDSLLIWREYRENSSYDDVCLYALGRIAGLLKLIGDFEFSVELSTLVVDHPQCLPHERISLRKHLDELEAKMPKKIFAEAQARGRERDLISTGEEMLVYLEREKENLRLDNTPLNADCE
jgi:tetratricopeptide (TPR) repeat protein